MSPEWKIQNEMCPVMCDCYKIVAAYVAKRKRKGDTRNWEDRLLSAIRNEDPQNIPKKLYYKMQNRAKTTRVVTLSSPHTFVRNLLKPFKWGWAPEWKNGEPPQINFDRVNELEKYSTGKLLKMLNETRGYYADHETSLHGNTYTRDELKHVLATRPHMPSKRNMGKWVKEMRAQEKSR